MDAEIQRRRTYYERSVAKVDEGRTFTNRISGTRILLPEFTGPAPGVTHPLPPDADEVDWFLQIFDEHLLRYITRCTNKYARQRRAANANEHLRSKWSGTTLDEIKAFIGILILFGIHWLPETQLFWAKHPCFGHLLVKRTFARDRFKLLQRYFYYCNQQYCRPGSALYKYQKKAKK